MPLVDSSLKILVVDDKANMRRTIRNLLKKNRLQEHYRGRRRGHGFNKAGERLL